MLIHLRPRIFAPRGMAELIDIRLEPFGLCLKNGVDIKTGHPYPNKHYSVAYRSPGRMAMDGILLETKDPILEFRYIARWAAQATVLTHYVDYKIIDKDFDAASEDMMLWHACCAELGGWSNRHPAGWSFKAPPTQWEPMMEVVPRDMERDDTIDVVSELIIERREKLEMPTIERERLFHTRLNERMPKLETAFRI